MIVDKFHRIRRVNFDGGRGIFIGNFAKELMPPKKKKYWLFEGLVRRQGRKIRGLSRSYRLILSNGIEILLSIGLFRFVLFLRGVLYPCKNSDEFLIGGLRVRFS